MPSFFVVQWDNGVQYIMLFRNGKMFFGWNSFLTYFMEKLNYTCRKPKCFFMACTLSQKFWMTYDLEFTPGEAVGTKVRKAVVDRALGFGIVDLFETRAFSVEKKNTVVLPSAEVTAVKDLGGRFGHFQHLPVFGDFQPSQMVGDCVQSVFTDCHSFLIANFALDILIEDCDELVGDTQLQFCRFCYQQLTACASAVMKFMTTFDNLPSAD